MRTCALKSVAPMMSMPMMMPVTRCRCIYGSRTQSILTIARVLRHVLACVWSCVRVVARMQYRLEQSRAKSGAQTQTTRQLIE